MTTHTATDVTTCGVTGALVVGTGINKSLDNTQSLLGSTVEQILYGDFVLYGSDVTAVVGSVFLIGNFVIGYRRYLKDKKCLAR